MASTTSLSLVRHREDTGLTGSEFGSNRLTADEMDDLRQKNITYQYLCHLEEAKNWIEACIEEDIPGADQFEDNLRHGVYLAKLAIFFSPSDAKRKIFDFNLERYKSSGLNFRHTDNIIYFLKSLKTIGLPAIFYPETTDIYEKKNMPRVIFCIHALSLYLFRLGIAPQIENLYGKIKFSDEVMEAMMKELSKFGCQMPQFGKIGGILASELPIDEAALHAAIIAVNEAIEKQDCKELYSTLSNPSSHLTSVCVDNTDSYLLALHDAQTNKREVAVNKSRDDSYIPDAYDELLTQAEIQGFISHTNLTQVVEEIESALRLSDMKVLEKALLSPFLGLKDIQQDCLESYLKGLSGEMDDRKDRSFNQSLMGRILSKSSIHRVIRSINEERAEKILNSMKLDQLNECLVRGRAKDTLNALYALQSILNPVEILDYCAPLYHEEMALVRAEAEADLTLEEVMGGVRLLTAVGYINSALDAGNSSKVWQCLEDRRAHIQDLDRAYERDYLVCLTKAKLMKAEVDDTCSLLNYLDIQETIDYVNEKKHRDNDKIGALTRLNEAIKKNRMNAIISSLQHPALGLEDISCEDGLLYFNVLMSLKKLKCNEAESDVELWLEDVLKVHMDVQQHLKVVASVSAFLRKINHALIISNRDMIFNLLKSCSIRDLHIRRDIIADVSRGVVDMFVSRKLKAKDRYPFVHYALHDGSIVFINIETGEHQWEEPADWRSPSDYLTIEDIVRVVDATVQDITLSRKIETCFVQLQASCRGYLVRQKMNLYINAAITIQSWWRKVQMRRNYLMYRRALKIWEPEIIKIQRAFRKYLQKRKLKVLILKFKKKEHLVVAIQRYWRNYKARQDFKALTHGKNPPLHVIRKFVHLLDVSSQDFEEELQLQKLKSEIVKTIRKTHSLESEVDELDVKIGLLVQNRITLQDMNWDKENANPNIPDVGTKGKYQRTFKDSDKFATTRSHRGLKALMKASRERLTGYQHLFYLLQTEPRYLASLIFALPLGKTTKFIENVIFTLYNYGANERDNYLLLKLFKTALEEEIRCKVLRLNDIVSGNPLVVKMVVSFNRSGAGQVSLRDMLGPLVDKVLADSNLQINTNPVEIYKTWVNQLEMNTGQTSGLPYVVTQEEALQHPEVQQKLFRAINALKETSLGFCDHITSSRDRIPYAMLYMAKVMKAALHKRFPHIPEKEILKVVGNLIYYRFINSAIVAPDAFDVITVAPDKKIANDQRRNLASIAKILQFAASKKGFGEEASHLMCLNPFIVECHEKFKTFFKSCCMVDEPELVYNVNQYSEATIIIKPTIYITLQEIVETHQLLLNHKDILAADVNDPLHDILEDLGEKPSIYTLLGEAPPHFGTGSSFGGSVGRTEICLALSKKFDLLEDGNEEQKGGKDSIQKLLTRTKQLIIDIVQCVDGDSLQDLTTGATIPESEAKYRSIVTKRAQQELEAKVNHTGLNRSNSFLGEMRVSLHEVKTKLNHNLRRLENQGLASRSDNYQALLSAVAVDIMNQREYRIFRRNEVQKLLNTSSQLEIKERFFKDQLQSYKTYLQTCLSNVVGRNKNVHEKRTRTGEKKNRNTIKYTACRLHEKGVVLEIEDLPEQQLKNVLFEITPLSSTGVFHIHVKFMGVSMEAMDLDIQDLLQLQYEGVSVKRMMGKAKINVNLLLHFLNSKFYSKKK